MTSVPLGLHARGSTLWEALAHAEGTALGVLALEACRAADRLDELDSIIAGKGVLKLMQFRVGEIDDLGAVAVTVGFNNVLAEARQQQANLRSLLDTLLKAAPAKQAPKDKGANPLAAVLALVQPAANASGGTA